MFQAIEPNHYKITAAEGRCYDCFRPKKLCFCAAIPTIDNRTEVLILQHRRERFHPFNTARIVQKALRNSRLIADHTITLATSVRLKPRSGLLFPGPSAVLISELAPEQRPEQLVVLDGTWHHAKTLVREIPALQSLPRYQLAPAVPSRYRIRRQPSVSSLSTVEAAVTALQILEPDTTGFDQLLRAFDMMVEAQLSHSGSTKAGRFRKRRNRGFKNVPRALLGNLENIIVAYGESAPGQRGQKRNAGPPISWLAQRLGSGETFSCTLTLPRPLNEGFLGHLGLTSDDFASALSLDEARARWAEFLRPGDVVTVFLPGTARLYSYLTSDDDPCLVLKSVDVESNRLPLEQRSFFNTAQLAGRAGKRLGEAIGFVRHLNALATLKTAGGSTELVF